MKCKGHLSLVVLVLSGQLLVQTQIAYAVIAKPGPIIYHQPDGQELTIALQGDEHLHWAETTDGFTVLANSLGYYEYADLDRTGNLILSGIRAHAPGNRSEREQAWLKERQKGLFFSQAQVMEFKNRTGRIRPANAPLTGGFPSTGNRKLLLILANFSNTASTYQPGDFDNFMNQPNYSGIGSFRDYYLEVSYGQLTVMTTVTIWVTLPNTHDYYGPQSNWGQFAYDAVAAAENQANVNFGEYDNNLDGVVDGVAIIHAGQGQEETANPADIWSHSWDLASAGYSTSQRTFDGVLVNAYTAMPEKNATGMGTIGVICHEFCHNLGAPDFYDTDYSTGGSYTGTGKWDLMGTGSWNGVSGNKPAHPNAWIKTYLDWTNPVLACTIQNVTLRNAQLYPDAFRFNTQTPNEYFLCENRQQTGFDAGIPGHGLIIYHVDGNFIFSQLATNTINCSSHQGLYPVCANSSGNPPSSYGTINGTGCPFPGTGGKTSFSDATTPNAHSWDNANTGFPLSNIFEYTPTQEISFCFISCNAPNDPASFGALPAGTDQINLAWTPNQDGNAVMIAYGMTPSFGTPVENTIYPAGTLLPGGGTVLCSGNATAFSHEGLLANTTYYYKAWSILAGPSYSMGVTARATTLCGTITSFPWTESFENGGVPPGCWTQEQVNNSGLNWIFTTGNGGTNPGSAHGGCYNACLKDKTTADNKTRLISPELDLTGTADPRLTFWHTQPVWGSDQDRLTVYYRNSPGGAWTQLAVYSANITGWAQETIPLPNPGPTYWISFEGNAKFGYGICLDDIQVASNCSSYVQAGITIESSLNPVYPGTTVTSFASPVNGGSTPSFQWKIGGIDMEGATNATFTHIPTDNEAISCLMISNAPCALNNPATSNILIMSVAAFPQLNILQNMTMNAGTCFDALETIVAGGGNTTFIVESGGDVTLAAGKNIRLLPGVMVSPGGSLHGFITPTGSYCENQAPSGNSMERLSVTDVPHGIFSTIRVSPNPTEGNFTIVTDAPGDQATEIRLDLYDMTGRKVLTSSMPGSGQSFSITGQPSGIYILKAHTGTTVAGARIIKL